ncbi:myeloid leukemia factor 2-like isoform X2 [Amblyomma americanum]
MSGASPKHVRMANRAKSPPSSASSHPLTDDLQPSITVCHGGDHRMRQSITIKSKVENSCSAKTVMTSVTQKGSSTRCVVQQRSITSNAHPEIVRATAFSREAGNGAVETVATYEDSRTGVRQLSVGRHIGDRSHLSEKSRNEFTGEEMKREQLVNIPYEELGGFDTEWQKRMAQS